MVRDVGWAWQVVDRPLPVLLVLPPNMSGPPWGCVARSCTHVLQGDHASLRARDPSVLATLALAVRSGVEGVFLGWEGAAPSTLPAGAAVREAARQLDLAMRQVRGGARDAPALELLWWDHGTGRVACFTLAPFSEPWCVAAHPSRLAGRLVRSMLHAA
jgi:hypothetical protein